MECESGTAAEEVHLTSLRDEFFERTGNQRLRKAHCLNGAGPDEREGGRGGGGGR